VNDDGNVQLNVVVDSRVIKGLWCDPFNDEESVCFLPRQHIKKPQEFIQQLTGIQNFTSTTRVF
jgi:hypothetical protein